MKNKSITYQITLTGLLTSLGVILGFFAHFPLMGGQVYLVGIIVFLMPLVLKLEFSLIGGLATIFLSDLLSGWVLYTWISLIAYTASILIIYSFKMLKLKFIYMIGIVLAGIINILIYFMLEYFVISKAVAISDLIATSVQFAIVIPISIVLYAPLKQII